MDIPAHLDLRNPHSFEMKDLENLIKKVSHKTSWLDFDVLTMTHKLTMTHMLTMTHKLTMTHMLTMTHKLTMTHMLTELEMLMVAEMLTLAKNEMQTEI